jgi:hypothetical protein
MDVFMAACSFGIEGLHGVSVREMAKGCVSKGERALLQVLVKDHIEPHMWFR